MSLCASIDLIIQNQLVALECERLRTKIELKQLQESSDAHLMHLVLQYFGILKEELVATRTRLSIDSRESEMQRRQAKILRDVRLFAHHLNYETKGKLNLTVLPQDSTQFKRCKKAVIDNISPNFLADFSEVKVGAVLKLEHVHIADQLQSAAASIENGKVKGLFCALPNNGLYPLCAYGLHAQMLPGMDAKSVNGAIADGLPGLFQIPWFCAGLPPFEASAESSSGSLPPPPVSSGTAERLAASCIPCLLNNSANINVNSPDREKVSSSSSPKKNKHKKDIDASGLSSGSTTPSPLLRFSRCSTPSDLAGFSRADLGEGVFLALCRVLVTRLRTVSGPITSIDVEDALKLRYDAVYSNSS